MTRNEEIVRAALEMHPKCDDTELMFFAQGADFADTTFLAKACQWLTENYEDIGIRWMRGDSASDFVERFKETMLNEV